MCKDEIFDSFGQKCSEVSHEPNPFPLLSPIVVKVLHASSPALSPLFGTASSSSTLLFKDLHSGRTIELPYVLVHLLLRDRSLFMTGVGTEDKMVG